MKVSRPLALTLSIAGVAFAESVHAQDFEMRPRADRYHKVLYVLRGRVRYEEKGRSSERVSAGAMLVVPEGVRHALIDEQASTLLLLGVADGFLQEEPEVAGIWQTFVTARVRHRAVNGPARAQFESYWRRALLERAHPRPGGEAAARALALQVFVLLARLPGGGENEDAGSRVRTVAREMEETLFERWTLEAAAVRAQMSRRHFTALFREVTGRTFWAHLTELRLQHSAQLLKQGEHSVTGVIFASGFGDVSQFYRLFRARFGQPPKRWAEGRGQGSTGTLP